MKVVCSSVEPFSHNRPWNYLATALLSNSKLFSNSAGRSYDGRANKSLD